MREQRKHADLIKMWANGWDMQVFDERLHKWVDCPEPMWSTISQYRRKPDPKPDTEYWLRTYEHSGGSIFTPHVLSPTEVQPANLKLTFDGETGKLKSAEVL